MYLFQRVEEVMATYQDARHTIAEFVLKEQKNLYKYTINDIAEETFTSKATVTRFAKVLGYQGWKDFIHDFVSELKYQELNDSSVDVNFPFVAEDSLEVPIFILGNYFEGKWSQLESRQKLSAQEKLE